MKDEERQNNERWYRKRLTERDIRIFIERYFGVKMSRRSSTGDSLGDLVGIIIVLIISIYGFLAFTNPTNYPILGKFIENPLITKLDPFIGIGIIIGAIYLIFFKEK